MNTHGWKPLEGVVIPDSGGRFAVEFAPLVTERHRCACPATHCARPATQEDLRCDECRQECP